MAHVSTVGGIFRKLGKPAAVQFIRDYVQERVHDGMSRREVEHLLWSFRSRTPGCENQAQAAVLIFNEMH